MHAFSWFWEQFLLMVLGASRNSFSKPGATPAGGGAPPAGAALPPLLFPLPPPLGPGEAP
eukprot:5942121-Amphidinium_carterae.1